MHIILAAFGSLRKYIPEYRSEIEAELPAGSVVRDLLALYGVEADEIGLTAVNGRLADETARLADSDRVEIFSPMEGGDSPDHSAKEGDVGTRI